MMQKSYQIIACEKVIFRAYDIRGIVDIQLNENVYFTIGYALGLKLKNLKQKEILLAYDGRLTSPLYSKALAQGLLAQDIEVVHLGMVPTGLMYFAAANAGIDSGLMVTGSHNPKDYNGLKMVLQGHTLQESDIQDLFTCVQALPLGQCFTEIDVIPRIWDVITPYIEYIKKDIQFKRPLKVIIDYGHGVGAVIGPQLFSAMNCEAIGLYDEVDGNFPAHHPDPTVPENLKDLIAALKTSDADVGIAFDGDADRLGIVTKEGDIIWPDRLMMLFVHEVLRRKPGSKIVYDVKCSKQLKETIEASGGVAFMSPTGHSLVKGIMKNEQAELAGEMSGHIFFKDRWFGFDDGVYSACRFLEILANYPNMKTLMATLPPSPVSTAEIKISIPEDEKFTFMQRFCNIDSIDDTHAITIDGLRLEFIDGWGLLRASNTSPCLISRFEASDNKALLRIQSIFKKEILKINSSLDIPF